MSTSGTRVLMPQDDGTLVWGGAVATVPTPSSDGTALTEMSNFIVVARAQLEDLITLGASTPGVDEVQQVAISGGGNSTNWTLSFGADTTPAFVKNPSADAVQAALEALESIGVGNVVVTGSGWTWNVAFQGALGEQDVDALAGNIVSGGGTIAVSTTTPGAGGSGPLSARSALDSSGVLLITLSDSSQSWTYRVVPAIERGSRDVVFVGELATGVPNNVAPAAAPATTVEDLIRQRERIDAQIKALQPE
jgi:hypothetical protein